MADILQFPDIGAKTEAVKRDVIPIAHAKLVDLGVSESEAAAVAERVTEHLFATYITAVMNLSIKLPRSVPSDLTPVLEPIARSIQDQVRSRFLHLILSDLCTLEGHVWHLKQLVGDPTARR